MLETSLFVSTLSKDYNPSSLKEAFTLVADSMKIGYVEAKFENSDDILFESSNFLKETFVKVGDDESSLIVYKDGSSGDWDETEVRIIADVALNFYRNIILKSRLKEASLVQFNTQLPNSYGLNQIVRESFKKEDLIGNYSLVEFNVRGFNRINKLYSVEAGNFCIKLIAKELRRIVRHDEVLAHQSSDVFMALVKNKRLNEFLKKINPVTINIKYEEDQPDQFITLYFTIAVVPINRDYKTFAEFFSEASIAMTYAKTHGMQIIYLDEKLKNDIETAQAVEMTIDDEIIQGHFLVYYQPKVDIRTGEIIGAEALVRWEKDGNIISPSVFVPILEKTGDIVKIDLFILDSACSDLAHYRKLGNHTVPLSVNISRRDLLVPGFYRQIVSIIDKYDLCFEDLVIEVTETTNLEEKQRMQEFIAYLKSHNIKTSLDDFGSGYSSLALVRDFDVNEIKLDRSFIDREYRDKDAIIIDSIISMANRLGIDVVVEGVETYEQLQFVKKFSCRTVQGFYFDKPLPKLEFEERLSKLFYDRKL